MSMIQSCTDVKDCVDLFRPQCLYLKPIARINVSVQLPQLKKSGAKISNWEVMEKVKEMARPFTFPVFKVNKSSLEFVRFEAEIENYSSMENVLAKLDMRTIKLSGFTELLKIRAAEAKTPFPTRADWDSFFKDNKDMNEMKAGERPDTIHLEQLPCKWFIPLQDKSGVAQDKPSEMILKKAFATFGDVRMVDIPMLDPYRHKMKAGVSGIKTFSFGQDLVFDAYVQFKEYIGFVKAMNALRGMKLCYQDRDTTKAWTANIRVDFDKTKHLSESMMKKRKEERERLIREEAEKEEMEKTRSKLETLQKKEQIKLLEKEEKEQEENLAAKRLVAEQRRLAREERRKQKCLKKMGLTEEEEIAYRIGTEERKLLLAQRKLESIRVLDELLSRVKGSTKTKEELKSLEKQIAERQKKHREERKGSDEELKNKEKEIREKLVLKIKKKAEDVVENQKDKISKVRTEGFESVSDEELSGGSSSSDGEEEEEEERKGKGTSRHSKLSRHLLETKSDQEGSEIGSDEELRLTSTEEEEEEDTDQEEEEERKAKKKKKKEKKEKKEKKDKKKKREKEKERDDKSERKKRELDRQIRMAERIASKKSPTRRERSRSASRKADLWEHEKYDRDRRERTPTGYYGAKDFYERRRQSRERDTAGDYKSERERDEEERRKFMSAAKMKRVNRFLQQQGMRKEEVEREMERAYEQYFSSLARKGPVKMVSMYDTSKEEEWERMINPHNFEGSGGRSGYRKPVLGQHYEDHQREQLQNEIRIRERREREVASTRSRSRDRRRSRSRSRGRRDRRDRR